MKHLIISIVLGLGLGTATFAQEDEIQSVIGDQLAAIQKDDFSAAFTHASPILKRIFQNPARFGVMVRQGYPMVHRPSSVTFKQMQERDGTHYQYVFIEDQAGIGYIAEYAMINTENGWKINGVSIKESNDIGA